ncbi:YbaB/EbfC family nucleoid-associated protein [Actinoplanes sp. NPDC051470]|uniref:YbaB/EbfC family nucleoid-associated protein n=1 Tax=unclassified Actinoplanes TaxID=2626549 RepID=UPI00341AF17B
MSDHEELPGGSGGLEAMFAVLADEQRKITEFQRKMSEASTVVESSNKMVTATFDGRGELTRLTFNNGKYRTMAPKELATMLMDTLKRGRAAAFGKIDEMAGRDVLPGIAFGELAAGKVDIDEVVGTLMTSVVDLPGIARAAKEATRADG